MNKPAFKILFREAMADAYKTSVEHGFWTQTAGMSRNSAEMIALIHSELSEALENLRHGTPNDEHCPEFLGVEIELADAIIRIMDMAAGLQLKLPDAIVAKMTFNESRPHKHRKNF